MAYCRQAMAGEQYAMAQCRQAMAGMLAAMAGPEQAMAWAADGMMPPFAGTACRRAAELQLRLTGFGAGCA